MLCIKDISLFRSLCYGKNNFYKLKKIEKSEKEKNYFCEIHAKKVGSKMDQQQNEQRQKGPQQNGLCQKDVLPKN